MMKFPNATALILTAAATWLTAPSAEATILTFDPAAPNFTNVDQSYGDRITSTSQGGFLYGVGSEGFTPNVVVGYGPAGADPARWTTGYGDLVNILFKDADSFPVLEIDLVADAGFVVRLFDFDMAAYNPAFSSPPSIRSLQILDMDDGGAVLFGQSDVAISETTHTTFQFQSPLTSRSLRIRFDSGNLGGLSDDIGIDNIRFGQAEAVAAVPEPAGLTLAGLALTLTIGRHPRRRRAGR